jgi:hypothetical protein
MIMKTKNKTQKTASGIQSKTKKLEKQFPGYPLYDPSEDITNNGKRIDADIEDTTLLNNKTAPKITNQSDKVTDQLNGAESDEDNAPADPYAVTKDDLEVLGTDELNGDEGDDDGLKHRVNPVDFSGEDLDVPGNELDDDTEVNGAEDEENNNYSIGGDNHNDLEEDQS